MPIWPPRVPPTVQAAFRDATARDVRARAAAAAVLGDAQVADRDRAIETLLGLCDDPDPAVRHAAMLSLANLRAEVAVPRLLDGIEDGAGPVRQAALLALAEIGDPSATASLERACRDERPEVRFQALSALARIDPALALGPVREALSDSNPEVRAQAIEAFEEIAGEQVVEAVRGLLTDPDARVRRAAALCLGRSGDPAGTEILLDALGSDDVFLDAADVLGRLGEGRAVNPLRRRLRRFLGHPLLKVGAAAALHRLGAPEGRAHLLAVLADRRWEVVGFAVEMCADLGLVEARPSLERLRDEPGPLDPEVIATALARLAGPGDTRC